MPATGLPYGSPAYWDARYAAQTDAAFDADEWYGRAGVEAVLGAVAALGLAPGSAALEVGCGGGRLADTLAAAASLALTATDISPTAIDRRRARGAAGAVVWRVADAAALPFASGSFALVIDKGTCDALDCDDGDGGGSDGGAGDGPSTSAAAALAEAARVLARDPPGTLVLASCRDPAARAPLLAGLFRTAAVAEVWAEGEPGRARPPCPEAYVYTLVPLG
jgi:SAM-dependent methyltransferase